MMTMEDFKDRLLKYLFVEQNLTKADIEKQKLMTTEEKIDNNFLLSNATIVENNEGAYVFNVPENYSKLRAGDRVVLQEEGIEKKYKAIVLDVYMDTITIECENDLNLDGTFSIETENPELLESLISCLEGIYTGIPGAAFLRLLAGEVPFEIDDFIKVTPEEIPYFDKIRTQLNEEQIEAVAKMLEYPPIHVLQGPPGTGKTLVLAATAIATAKINREVVIIANTHHAVNNALQKIRSMDKHATLIKVGETLKAEELDSSIYKFKHFAEYYEFSYKNRKKKKYGHIIGMTIWSAIAHLGLRHHIHFRPYISLVDEASLMTLTMAAILGKVSPSICLFGDSRQMPPIFRPELEKNVCSISILDYCAEKVEGVPVTVLHTTYRMNDEITAYVSKNFYEPYGEKLISSDSAKDRRLSLSNKCGDKKIESLLNDDTSIRIINVTPNDILCEDCNNNEALFAAKLVSEAIQSGVDTKKIAVITQYRRQVKQIRSFLRQLRTECEEYPLVDTVERLQGQDVEMIVVSMCVSDPTYLNENKDFIINPHRLNVMISRAKRKVIILASKIVQDHLIFVSGV